jgi:hypothetical protein
MQPPLCSRPLTSSASWRAGTREPIVCSTPWKRPYRPRIARALASTTPLLQHHCKWQKGARIAAAGGADRRSAKNADRPMHQSREAHPPGLAAPLPPRGARCWFAGRPAGRNQPDGHLQVAAGHERLRVHGRSRKSWADGRVLTVCEALNQRLLPLAGPGSRDSAACTEVQGRFCARAQAMRVVWLCQSNGWLSVLARADPLAVSCMRTKYGPGGLGSGIHRSRVAVSRSVLAFRR